MHDFGKSFLFLISGNILNVYKTKKIKNVRNLIKVMPINAVLLILGVLVITGVPPFPSFISEYSILISLIIDSNYVLAGIFLLCLLIVFAGFINVFVKMVFTGAGKDQEKSHMDKENIYPLFIIFFIVVYLSVFTSSISGIINNATGIIIGM